MSADTAVPGLDPAKRARLFEIIKTKSVLTGGDFKLASGGQSSVFFDMKMTLLDPEGLNLAADLSLQAIADLPCEAVGGLVLGACPIVDAIAMKSWPARPLQGFYVRKEPKDHGTTKLIEGPLAEGATAIMLEDVSTRGGSVLKAIVEARRAGCRVDHVLTMVDRQQGAADMLKGEGVTLHALYLMEEFVED